MDPLSVDSADRPSVSIKKKKQHQQQQITPPPAVDPKLPPSPPLSADDVPTDPLLAGLFNKQQQQQQHQQQHHQQRRRSTTTTVVASNKRSSSILDPIPSPLRRNSVNRPLSSSSSSTLIDTPQSPVATIPTEEATMMKGQSPLKHEEQNVEESQQEKQQHQEQDHKHSLASTQPLSPPPPPSSSSQQLEQTSRTSRKLGHDNMQTNEAEEKKEGTNTGKEEEVMEVQGRGLISEPLDQPCHVQAKYPDQKEKKKDRQDKDEEEKQIDHQPATQQLQEQQQQEHEKGQKQHKQQQQQQQQQQLQHTQAQAQVLHPLVSQLQQHDAAAKDDNGKAARENSDQATLTQGSLQGEGGGGSIWSGQHPLFQDFAAPTTLEPETLDDDDDEGTYTPRNDAIATTEPVAPYTTTTSTSLSGHNYLRQRGLYHIHHKGQSMSAVEGKGGQDDSTSRSATRRRQTSNQISSQQLSSSHISSSALRRRAVGSTTEGSNGNDVRESDHTNIQHVDQRRVIIHPVAPGDTLQGLGLYYGIQISVLKKSNKLWTNDSIHSRKFLYIPIEECSVLRQAGAKIDDEKNKVILPPRHPPSKGSSVFGVSSKDLRVRRARSKSLLASSHAPGQMSWATLGNLQEPMQRRALTPEIPKIGDRGGKESGQHLDSPNYFDTMPSASTLPINNAYESEDPLHFSEDPSESGSPLTVLSHSRLSEPATPLTSVGTKNTLSSVLGKSKAAPPVPSSAMTTTTLLTGSASSPLSPKRMSMTSLPSTIKSQDSSGSSSRKGKQRQHGRRGGSSSGGGASSDMSSSSPSVAVPFSEDLPATLIVHPSMTHEALAQRFKHMKSASKENRSHSSGSGIGGSSSASGVRQQELRTNPVHNLHQVVDIRPPHIHRPSYSATRKSSVDSSSGVASVPPSTHDTRVQPQLSSGLTEGSTNEAQPPKVENLSGEQTLGNTGDTASGALEPPRALPEESVADRNDVSPDVSEKVAAATSLPEDAFIIYGHHEYIYRNQDQSSDEASFASDHEEYSTDGGEVSSLSENDEVGDGEIGHGRRRRQREQEVVTIPAGRLSFFPSAEHSKRLETPEPILRLQNNSTTGEDGDGYFPPYGSISGRSKSSSSSSGPSSRASTHSTASSLSGYLPNLPAFFSSLSKATGSAGNAGSSSSGGGGGSQPSRQYKGGSTRQRTALDANTFKAPTKENTSKTEAQAPVGSTARARPATMYVPHTQGQHHHVRGIPVKPTTKRTSSSQWSSFMSDTFVDDILGAVRSRLQIARRLYLGNTSVVGAIMGGDAYSRLYLGMSAKRRSIGGLETESIELDLSATPHRYSRDDTLSDAAPTVMAQLPQRRQEPSRTLSPNYSNEPPQQKQHGQHEVVEEEKCHQRETSGASSIFENDDEDGSTSRVSKRRSGSNHLRYHSQGSLKRRSLRTSNPVNYPALAALVNDMDAEQKKNKKQQQQQQQINGVEKECVSSSGATMTTTTTAATLIGEKEAIESGKEQPSSPIFDPLASTLAVSTR